MVVQEKRKDATIQKSQIQEKMCPTIVSASPDTGTEDLDLRCGYGSCKPTCLQKCNNSYCLLATICWFVFVQSEYNKVMKNILYLSLGILINNALQTSQSYPGKQTSH